MIDKREFLKIKDGVQSAANNNYQELLGFLQRFYAVNVVREIASQDDELKGEVNTLVQDSLVELYNSDCAKKYINGLVDIEDDGLRMRVTTMALMEGVFPEFLDGSFNPGVVKNEQREMANILLATTDAYKSRTPEFKSALSTAMNKPIDRSSYTEVRVSQELKKLIHKEYSPYQR